MEFQLVLVDTVLLCGITDDSSITQPEGMILSRLGLPCGPNVVRASICALLHRLFIILIMHTQNFRSVKQAVLIG